MNLEPAKPYEDFIRPSASAGRLLGLIAGKGEDKALRRIEKGRSKWMQVQLVR
jgi:hypothetical protein